jgi:DNA repair exonuclease SbcCD ATPase subunit
LSIARQYPGQYHEEQADIHYTKSLVHQKQKKYQAALGAHKAFTAFTDTLYQRRARHLAQNIQNLQSLMESEIRSVEDQISQERYASAMKAIRTDNERKQLEIEIEKQKVEQAEKETRVQADRLRRELSLQAYQDSLDIARLRQSEADKEAELLNEKAKEALAQSKLAQEAKEKIQLERELLLAGQEKKQLQDRGKQRFYWGIYGFTFLLLLFTIVFLVNSRKKNRVLIEQKAEIAEAHQEVLALNEEMTTQKEALVTTNEDLSKAYTHITDSIQYAQRIQNAILVPPVAGLSRLTFSKHQFAFIPDRTSP